MSPDRTQQIEQAIAQAEAHGQPWTNQSIYNDIGGNYGEVAQYLKARRAQAGVEPARACFTPAVAVDEDEAASVDIGIPLSNGPRPQSPLAEAREQRDQTRLVEHTLGVQEQALKTSRLEIDTALQVTEYGAGRWRSDAADREAREHLSELRLRRQEVEARRQSVHQKRQAAYEQAMVAAEQYETCREQAADWLRRLRGSQLRMEAARNAQVRGDAREAYEQALAALVALVGQAETETLVAQPTTQPAWLRD